MSVTAPSSSNKISTRDWLWIRSGKWESCIQLSVLCNILSCCYTYYKQNRSKCSEFVYCIPFLNLPLPSSSQLWWPSKQVIISFLFTPVPLINPGFWYWLQWNWMVMKSCSICLVYWQLKHWTWRLTVSPSRVVEQEELYQTLKHMSLLILKYMTILDKHPLLLCRISCCCVSSWLEWFWNRFTHIDHAYLKFWTSTSLTTTGAKWQNIFCKDT